MADGSIDSGFLVTSQLQFDRDEFGSNPSEFFSGSPADAGFSWRR